MNKKQLSYNQKDQLVTGLFAVGFNRGVIKLSHKALKMTGIITGLFAVGFNRRTSNAYIIFGLKSHFLEYSL